MESCKLQFMLLIVAVGAVHLSLQEGRSESSQGPRRTADDTIANLNSATGRKTTCQKCEMYHYSHCSEMVTYYRTRNVSMDCLATQANLETTLRQISSSLYTNHGAEIDCLKGSRWALCLTVMRPGCHIGSSSKRFLCREACHLIKDQICLTEWGEIIQRIKDGFLSIENIFPNCTKLPSLSSSSGADKCLYPDVFSSLKKSKSGKTADDQKNKSIVLIIAASSGGLGFIFILISILFLYRRCKMKMNRQNGGVSMRNMPKSDFYDGMTSATVSNEGYDEDNPLYSKAVQFDDLKLEKISRDMLRYIEPIAEGAFGKVVKCELFVPGNKSGPKLAAVKYLKDDASEKVKKSFSNEAEIIGSFHHPNIVSLLGICIDDKGPPCMILEYMDLGDLTKYVREKSGSYHASFGRNGVLPDEVEFKAPEISFKQLAEMARQIASGMAYLADHRYVHRDLATRNCLLNKDINIKIADFGLAHDVSSAEHDYYRIDGQHLLPIRWLPPEALTVGKFTVQSDIWAYGVVLWELFTYGVQPFYGQSNEEVCDRIRCMKLLGRPDGCPQRVYQLMKNCWKYDPMKRLPFSKLYETLTMWTLTGKGHFLEDAWSLMLKPVSIDRAPTLPSKRKESNVQILHGLRR